ncbi:MAG TPA: radical SAM protein [Anaerolineae bacterium]
MLIPSLMSQQTSPPSFGRRLWAGFRRDINGLLAAFTPAEPPAPGMYTYRLEPNGGQTRLHLRIEQDGSGVLFVDVTDIIHLNPTAAEMAKLALDEAPLERARAGLLACYTGVDPAQLTRELSHIYGMVDRLYHPDQGCPTCSIVDIQRTALFSTPVQAPYKVDMALTYGCNNECPHCYNEPDRYGMPSLPKEDWFRVIDLLHEVGVPHLILTGGEATLHPALPDIIRYADRLGHVVGLNTNGRRIAHNPYMQTLAEAGLNHVQVTLGSCHPAVHDAMMGAKSFEQTVRGIENALASRVHVITNTTLMRANMGHAEQIIEFLYELGIRTFAMNGMIYSGGGFTHPSAIHETEMPPLLIRVRDRAEELGMRFLWYTPTEYCRMSPVELEIGAKRCNAGEYSMCIEPNGDVLPCQSYYVAAGNILRDPWEKIWTSRLFRTFRDRELDPRWAGLPEKCWECPDLPLCGGGCRIEREAREGRRTADEAAGGGCAGCSGSCGTGAVSLAPAQPVLHTAGFSPTASTTRTATRATGQMPGFIPIAELGQAYPASTARTSQALDLTLPIWSETPSEGGCGSGQCSCH